MGKLRDKMIRDMQVRHLRSATQESYLRSVRAFAAHFMKSPDEMGAEEIKTFLAHLRDGGRSASTMSVYRCGLRFLFAVTLGRPDVVDTVPHPKRHLRKPRILTGSQIEMLADAMPSVKHRAIFMTIYSAGLRISEACSLRVDAIDSGGGRIYIRDGKGGKDRWVKLSPRLLTLLRDYWRVIRPKGPFLFPGRDTDRPIRNESFRKMLRRVSIRHGLKPHVTPHHLRHTYATHMLELGADVRVLQILLGHAAPSSTEHYIAMTSRVLTGLDSPLDVLATDRAGTLG